MSRVRNYWLSLSSLVQSALGIPVTIAGSPPLTNEVELLTFLLQTPELEKILIDFGIAPQVLLTAVLQSDSSGKGSIKTVVGAVQRAKSLQPSSAALRSPLLLNTFIAEIAGGSAIIRAAVESVGFKIGAFLFCLAHGIHEEDVVIVPSDDVSGKYGIEVVDDCFTPMEFVVWTLMRHFKLTRADAINAMLQVHYKGFLFFSQDSITKAREIADAANQDARKHGVPLLCRVVANPEVTSSSTSASNTDTESRSLIGQQAPYVGAPAETWFYAENGPTSPLAEEMRSFSTRLGCNIQAGIKVSLFRAITIEQLAVSWIQVVGLLVLSVLLPLGTQILRVGANGEFSAGGLTGILFLFPMLVITAVLVAKLTRQDEKILALVIVLLGTNLAIELFTTLLPFLLKTVSLSHGYNKYSFYMDDIWGGWLALAAFSMLRRLLQLPRKQGLVAALIVGFLILVPQNYVWMDRTLWSRPYDADDYKEKMSVYSAAAEEDALYLQPKLLSDQLKNILPGQPGASNIYFVGVAGDSEQDVFMKEINSVGKLFEYRFGSATHAIKLINNRSTLKTTPMASTTSLKTTIQRMGEVMNPDSDILFLYMTSHGSKEHTFSIEFPPLQLKDLEPKALRKMLDDAGIKWRIIVIAACYSGGFIDPIKSDNTLVITAAAGDRTSFGCSNENDYTYFGKAYFVDGLKDTDSFIRAFEIAKEVVTKREIKDGFEPSNPQISIGKNIEVELSRFDSHRQAAQR